MTQKKYFKTKKEAVKACEERRKRFGADIHIFKMPKGSRHVGQFAVCSEIEYLNTY